MEINLIWAQNFDGGIGENGELPWHISEDLKNFKKITLNSIIIMGRKTWDSLPFKPLPNRRNIVLSKNKIKNVEVYHNIDECLDVLKKEAISKVFIIGGASIYKLFFNHASQLHITFINIQSNSLDTFFPINHDIIKQNFIQKSAVKLTEQANYTVWVKK
jgi:dihydrofolate reductase